VPVFVGVGFQVVEELLDQLPRPVAGHAEPACQVLDARVRRLLAVLEALDVRLQLAVDDLPRGVADDALGVVQLRVGIWHDESSANVLAQA